MLLNTFILIMNVKCLINGTWNKELQCLGIKNSKHKQKVLLLVKKIF